MPLTDSQRADFSRLVKGHPVILFMKGNRRSPACGFSAAVVGILEKLLPTFHTIDILQDPHVREGMKEFSNWPTFPQLYIHGEFVGGCDIVKEIDASGDLKKLLTGTGPADGAPPRDLAIVVTPAAIRALQEALGGPSTEVLRLEIDAEYNNDLHIGPPQDGDIGVALDGIVLYIAASSAPRADGLAIDFVRTPGGMAFKIDNPKAPVRVKSLAPNELKAMLEAGTAHLFDVRPEGERALASIPGATPLEGRGLDEIAELGAAIVLHCHHGMRSRAAAQQLIGQGFTNVYNLEGGIEAWSRDVDPSVPRY